MYLQILVKINKYATKDMAYLTLRRRRRANGDKGTSRKNILMAYFTSAV